MTFPLRKILSIQAVAAITTASLLSAVPAHAESPSPESTGSIPVQPTATPAGTAGPASTAGPTGPAGTTAGKSATPATVPPSATVPPTAVPATVATAPAESATGGATKASGTESPAADAPLAEAPPAEALPAEGLGPATGADGTSTGATEPPSPGPQPEPSGTSSPTGGAAQMGPTNLVRDSNRQQVLDIFAAINAYRSSLKLRPVQFNPTISGLTQEWSNYLGIRDAPVIHSSSFLNDPRVKGYTGAGEIIAWRSDRSGAGLVEQWKKSPAHDKMMRNPNFTVAGIGVTFTDGTWQTPNRFATYGVVNFYRFAPAMAGTVSTPAQACGKVEAMPGAPCARTGSVRAPQPVLAPKSSPSIKSPADVVAADQAGTLWNYGATGRNGFTPRRAIGRGWFNLKEAFVSDWNKDGVQDIVAQWRGGKLSVYPGRAGGGFASPITVGTGGWQDMTITVGHWSGSDAYPAVVGYDRAGGLYYYRNPGGRALANPSRIGSGWGGLQITMTDFDGDGKQGLLAKRGNGELINYRSNGKGSFLSERRPVVGRGWGPFDSLRTLYGWNGNGSKGLMVRHRSGSLHYYPMGRNTWSAPVRIGSGWNPFNILA